MLFDEDIKNALNTLKNGGVIIYPTDTIWGIGCDATNQSAVERINTIKLRRESKSLIILADSVAMLERYVREVPSVAYDLIEVSDSPLTIIYPEGKNLASGICSDDGSVGIRICRDDFCSELITRLRRPLVSTSANRSGEPFPSDFSAIDHDLLKEADYVVKYRQEDRRKNSPSPVIKIDKKGVIEIIRK
ncbi:MAG: threonylcarbamoyl-AMP synthase [Bacteroidales bacterium]|jgi:L-threonylcarbamoyladenylate synthase|nr:threonylcarbamoyl-AMP synthase [Bacteroidales bacterium]NMD01659.1 threonylcarbamoyl-AMP synthase [Bacteroidales bacterium]OQB62553.1 MAG: Threonylcarbamoyl-AMP synthase [Bacteroidetes bacterium ADurb.Bin145]HOU01231.1 L-threonylcarbamoyladenylate synthase [Bacteroidales bacterium]HQK67166.1 L-threonylcarbamoyladenylate synthase [Bacteroidales bacterium]